MKIFQLLLSLSLCCAFLFCQGQNNSQDLLQMQSKPLSYQVTYTAEPIVLDGHAEEACWQQAAWSSAFIDIEGSKIPAQHTAVKMLWDDKYLYVFAKLSEKHIWGNLKQRDTIIYHNNDFEIFIKPNPKNDAYFEIEVNPLNTIMDLMLLKPYRFGGKAQMQWDAKGLKSAISYQGTLNDPSDIDESWCVEMAIPFADLNFFGEHSKPQLGEIWRINFSRVQWQHEIQQGQYSRKKAVEEDNWVWSPIGIVNMHYPERWGYLEFQGPQLHKPFTAPADAAIRTQLWELHYRINLYHKQHKRYPAALSSLLSQQQQQQLQKQYSVEYLQSKNFYRIQLVDRKNPKLELSIDHRGQLEAH